MPDAPPDDPFVTHSLRTSLFFPTTRLFVAGNPKAAGTSLRWWLLEAHGVDVAEATADSLWGESAPDQVVWDARVDLRHTWDRLDDAARNDALTAADVLSVLPVRHPVTRTFASWASKYLTGEPGYEERLPEDLPRLPEAVHSAEEVAAHFADFVAALARHVQRAGWAEVDVHFWPQHRLLARVPEGTTLWLRQEETAEGLRQVTEWLADHGVTAGRVTHRNAAVVAYQPRYADGALDAVAALYAADFERYGYEVVAPDAAAATFDAAWLNDVRGRNRRYGVVHEAAVEASRRAAHLERQLRDVRAREDELRRRVHDLEASTSWHVTAPLRRITGALRRD